MHAEFWRGNLNLEMEVCYNTVADHFKYTCFLGLLVSVTDCS